MQNLKETQKLGQSIWLDFINSRLITSGKLKELIEEGVNGITTNPSIFNKAISQGNDYDDAIRVFLKENPAASTRNLYDHLTIKDIRMAAELLRPTYYASDEMDGMISLEVSPELEDDAGGTIAEAERLWKAVSLPNLMIKVPATKAGISAIEELIARGINVNVTLMFSMSHYEAVSQAYMKGIARNRNPRRLTSVASFFVSRVDTYIDKELEKIGTPEALALRGKAAIANCKLVYQRFRDVFSAKAFDTQRKRGARVQRVLWGSTSTKNPAYPDVLYADNLIGADTINTLPMETIDAFRDHGKPQRTIDSGLEEAKQALDNLKNLGVNLEAITEQLQVDGVKAFADAFSQLMAALEKKRQELKPG